MNEYTHMLDFIRANYGKGKEKSQLELSKGELGAS